MGKYFDDLREKDEYNPGEVWMAEINPDTGNEGKNLGIEGPIIILKQFNKDKFWGIPMTSNGNEGGACKRIMYKENTVWALLSQFKTFDYSRLLHRITKVSDSQLLELKEQLNRLM